MRTKRIAQIGAAVFLTAALVMTGCGHKKMDFPLKKTVELTYWMPLNSDVGKVTDTMACTPLFQELERRTGVKLNVKHPPIGQHTDQFELMVASDELPDLFEYDMAFYKGGAQKALSDGVILPLNDKLEQVAPNLLAVLRSNQEWDREVKTDSGVYYTFPFIRGDERLRVYAGPMVRRDWLDELNLAIPQTIADWEEMLTLFKEKKNAEAPLTFELKQFKSSELFAGAYGVSNGMFLDDREEVKYGPIMPAYKTFLATLRRWFNHGLIDRDFATNDAASARTKMMTDRAGASSGGTGNMLGTLIEAMKDSEPSYDLAAAPYPTLEKGQRAMLGQLDPSAGQKAFVSPACSNPEVAIAFLDYGYSQEGHLLYNFGIEGESYTLENNEPIYTDEVLHNPDGLPLASSLGQYVRATYNGPFVQDAGYLEQYCTLVQQRNAIRVWGNTDAKKHRMPATTPKPEEAARYAQIMREVDAYCEQMYLRFILGSADLNEFDSYVQKVKSMGIEEAIAMEQKALDRYRGR